MKVGTTWLILLLLGALQFLTPDYHSTATTRTQVAETERSNSDHLFPEAIEPSCPSPQADYLGDTPEYPIGIDIDVTRLSSWTTNAFEAWLGLGEYGGLVDDFKKSYEATVTFEFSDGRSCVDGAQVRLHGDGGDHLRTISGLQTSLDISLDSANLAGFVDFKLFLPETRNGDNEIFATTLSQELGFLTPRTFYINATVNGAPVRYLVQEKFRKELLEYQQIPESPIFQVDERFGYLWTEHTDSADTISNPHIFRTSRLSNSQFAKRGPIARAIVQEGLARLNQVYAQVAAARPGALGVDQLPGVDPQTGAAVSRFVTSSALPILGNSASTSPSEASMYTALLLAMGSDNSHGLKSHNQRFVYDPWIGIVRPIYYDGQFSLIKRELSTEKRAKQWLKGMIGFVEHEFTPDTDPSLVRVTPSTALAAKALRDDLASIDLSSFSNSLAERGALIGDEELRGLMAPGGVIDENLAVISQADNLTAPNFVPAELYKGIYDPSIRIVFGSVPSGMFTQCTLSEGTCTDLALSDEQQVLLLRGNLRTKDFDYLYIGNSIAHYKAGLVQPDHLVSDWQHGEFVGKTTLSTNGPVAVEIDYTENVLTLVASSPEARAVIWNGELDDWTVIFRGSDISQEDSSQADERYDTRGITGCLSFRDVDLSNLIVMTDGGSCEDSIHFLRASGTVARIDVGDARMDAVDMDYSNLDISTIAVKAAGNDCLDLSSGTYVFETVEVERCADKAVSVGEAAISNINSLRVTTAPTGIASKDSSVATIDRAIFTQVGVCATAYRKKQAYNGGIILLKQSTCGSGDYRQQQGSRLIVQNP